MVCSQQLECFKTKEVLVNYDVQLWSRESFPQNVFLCKSAETVTGVQIIHMLVKTACLSRAKKCLYKVNQDLHLSLV